MFVRAGDIDIHVAQDGPPGGTPLVLLHSLGASTHLFDPQITALSKGFRVIRPDMRGHGLTTATPGPGSMAQYAADLAALLDALEIKSAHIGGVSIGGMVAQAFAAAYPGRARSLILIDTAMAIPPAQFWQDRALKVRAEGMEAVADGVVARWYTPGFINTTEAQGMRAMLARTPAEGYAAGCEAIVAADLTGTTSALKLPALIMVGEHDAATPVTSALALHQAIPGSWYSLIKNASHIPNTEQPDAVNAGILEFLAKQQGGGDVFEAGMAVRKQVLGEAHVARASANITDLDRDFQAFITRIAWGSVWTRPGLDRRTRSLLTIAMMAALGHEEELKLHLRASKNTGASPEDIAEVMMQVAVYAGVPAANSAIRHAKEIFKEIYG